MNVKGLETPSDKGERLMVGSTDLQRGIMVAQKKRRERFSNKGGAVKSEENDSQIRSGYALQVLSVIKAGGEGDGEKRIRSWM